MSKIKVKPSKPGLKVTNPKHGRHLPEEGEFVDLSIYWRRRLKCGDVVEVKEPKKETKKVNTKSKPKNLNSDIDKESEE